MQTKLSLVIVVALVLFSQLFMYGQCDQLIWSDEFSGTELDESKWSYQRGTWSPNGSQVQNCYVDDNTTVSNGTLKITGRYEPGYDCFNTERDFTSSMVQTKNRISWTYGVFQARVKVPQSNSTWPAFWMSPQEDVYGIWPRSGEIDIFEIRGWQLDRSHANAHWGLAGGDKRQDKGTYTFAPGDDASQWHIYEVEWNEGELKFYIDGNHYHTVNDFRAPNATTHPGPFNIDFYLRLNLAIGGNYLKEPWNDANNAIDQLPATMEVDWVRVFERTCDPYAASCDIISNGDFSNGLTDWSLVEFGTQGTLQIEPNGFAKIDVITPAAQNWRLALRQANISLEQGKSYTISFDAYADANRSTDIIMSKKSGAQYAFLAQNLTTTPTSYTAQFTMNDISDDLANFNFNVGASAIDVYINNISISEDDCIPQICDLDVSNINDVGPESLKEAIQCAEDGAIISINSILAGQNIFIQDAPIIIDKNLTLQGHPDSPTYLNGTNVTRLFEVIAGVTLQINDIHLVGGQGPSAHVILNHGTTHLAGVEVFHSLINNNPNNQRLGGNGTYILDSDVLIHRN